MPADEPEAPQDQERMVCPSCHHQNDPAITFCQNCGAPLGFAATMSPFEQIQAEGFALRQATTGRPKFILVIGVWFLFLPVWLASSVMFIEQFRYTDWTVADKFQLLTIVFFWLISTALLWCSTANYLRKRRRKTDENAT